MQPERSRNHKSNKVMIGDFYISTKEGKQVIREDLFDKKALEIANKLYTTSTYNNRQHSSGVGGTQLRRIFDEVKRFEYLLQLNENEWQNQLPYIKMIKSKIRYTVARAIRNERNRDVIDCYEALALFISEGIDSIKEQRDYEVFLALFEAVYGFYYEHAPNRS